MSLEIALERIREAKEYKEIALDLSSLNLEYLPESIKELTHIQYLLLNDNKLSNIDFLRPLFNLKLLTLSNNKLKSIPTFLLQFQIPILWEINKFTIFHIISSCIAHDLNLARDLAQYLIRILNLNLIQDLDRNLYINLATDLDLALSRYRDIDLNLDYDSDLFLDRALTRYRALARDLAQYLDRYQKLQHRRYFGQELENYRSLALGLAIDLEKNFDKYQVWIQAISFNINSGIYLKNNPFEAPSPEIIQQGNDAIQTFISDYINSANLQEVKVILLGEGASGKTSLSKRLINQKFDKKEQQTHGIKISKHRFQIEQEELLVNFWDFGGQEIMHATHQFFLTKRCLYLLVLDSRKDEKAEYWLNYIQSFGGDAPVLVVLNKTDENPSFDVNRKFLSKKYPNIKAYYKVSCLSQIGIPELKKDILNFLWNLDLRQTAFPKSWFKVKVDMEDMTEDYIGYAKYQSICQKNHVHNAQSQKVLLELLNDLGVVLNYEQLRLYDTQVLNPLWLTNAVYRIINSPILAKANGRFHINELDAIINDERYQKENPEHWTNIFNFWKPEEKLDRFPEEKFLFIVAMMKQFEILFQIDEFHYLIPGLLAEEENTYQFDEGEASLSFIIEYNDFLPTAIIPRLMVKMHKYIYNNQMWKTGMVLEEKLLFNSIANIVLDKESRKILIEIKGDRNRDFLTVIRETIKEINASYQDLDVTEWIPLPELYKEEELLVDYQELLGYEAAGQPNYFSGKLRKAFPVEGLLNGIEKPESRKIFDAPHIFISYAAEDEKYKEQLLKHLMSLVRLNKATFWDNTFIDAGAEWEKEIFENLEKADIVLCLISSGFINSNFCYAHEMTKALVAHQAGQKAVIPIRIRQVNWDQLEIAKILGLPAKRWMKNPDDDEAWTEISKGIEAAIDEWKKR